ncbi:hypothetical protein GCM10007301_11580 [Azorhizobium oxalatiphilum]|uniref:ABC transporter domain-containing protein n=1 Tax=Azorhizobium oxalatiphilum TaxID=980631 RepID=A0A917BTF2_9HYPH|nr:hypothetical protein GCM10007301_11580 [Azorhizobium oxalatiphilum]
MDLTIAKGSFMALAGPSGAGKTTLLRLLAGLMPANAGHIRLGSTLWCDVARGIHLPVRRRSIGFVFQDYALFPNMSVRGNVDYALGRHARRGAADELLELVGLGALASASPARLSGGQKQRLALIRALARRPDLLLLDEPLSALDPQMRRQLQDELKRLHREFGTTTIMVSHDTAEILRLADRVIRLENGRVTADDAGTALADMAPRAGLRVFGHHVSGPDETGHATVSIDGQLHRLRYQSVPPGLAPGDLVTLQLETACVQPTALP